MGYNIRRFLFWFVLGISMSVYGLTLLFLYYNEKKYLENFDEAVNLSMEASSEKISRNIVTMCNLAYSNTLSDADVYLSDLHRSLSAYGDISVIDEEGKEYTYSENSFESSPILKFGDLEIKNSEDIDSLLNNIKGNEACDFAIYLRVNADADLLNIVSTRSHLGDIYTPEDVIFRVGEDGKDSAVINSLLLKESVDELVALPNTYIYIRYLPIIATSNTLNSRFIGALVCYMEEKNLNRIYEYLKDLHIKADGFYWIMEDLNNGDYRYKLSRDSAYDGNLLSENKASQKEKDYVTNLTLTAKFLRSGETSTDFIDMENGKDKALISYLYFEPWNWIIGTTVFKSQMEDFSSKVPSFSSISISTFFYLIVFIFLFSFILSFFAASPITHFFDYVKRNFGKDNEDSGEKFKSPIVDFKKFVYSLKELEARVDKFSKQNFNAKERIANLKDGIAKNAGTIELLAQKQCEDSTNSHNLIMSMYALSEKLTEFSEKYKVDAKNTLRFTRQKAQSLRLLRRESELLKDIGGGFSSRFLRIRNLIENLSALLEDLKNYADKTKKLGENMELEIKGKEGETVSVFSALVEDTNSFYGETALSIVTMKDFLGQMKESIDSTISEMRDFLILIDNGIAEVDDILEKITTIIEQIATQQSRFQEISRGASMQSEAILQVLKIINDVKRYTESTKGQVAEFSSILKDLEKSYSKLKY